MLPPTVYSQPTPFIAGFMISGLVLVKLCRLTKAYGENSCRSQPIVDDVIIAAIEMGRDILFWLLICSISCAFAVICSVFSLSF